MKKKRNNNTQKNLRTKQKQNKESKTTDEVLKTYTDFFAGVVTYITNENIFALPLDQPGINEIKIPKTNIKGSTLPKADQFIIIKSEKNRKKTSYQIVKIFDKDDENIDLTRVIYAFELPEKHENYIELENISENLPESELINRKDYRDLFTITIDGEDSKDFDDAISIEKKGQDYILYVHIADVSAFVELGSPLDMEAMKRGTSFYLGNRVIPMLPEELSNELCSLKADNEKLTLTAEITIDKNGEFKSSFISRGIIQVDNRLTYNSSQKILEDETKSNKLSKNLKMMNFLAGILRKKRISNGRLDLNLKDEKMIFEGSKISDLKFYDRFDSHYLIEEFMLTANEVVAKLLKDNKITTLYRVHEDISSDSLDNLVFFLDMLHIPFSRKGDLGRNIQTVLKSVKGKDIENVVNFIVLKSLMQAFYGVEPHGHFGLGFDDYTHFTSPIRRYPDLVVHRCLKALIDEKTSPYSVKQLIQVGSQSSTMERIAQKAERNLFKMKACRIMKNKIGQTYKGVISGVAPSGFFVALSELPVEGMVPLRTLNDDYYAVKELEHKIVGKRTKKSYMLGDKVTIKLRSVDLALKRIDFELLDS